MFKFTECDSNGFKTFADKEKSDIICNKWGLSNLIVKTFTFTGQISDAFDPNEFLVQFFRTPGLPSTQISSVGFETLKTNVIGPNFFKKLWSGPVKLVRDVPKHPIYKCMDRRLQDIWISDLLQTALLDDESDEYAQFTEDDRRELIFRIMKAVVIGGDVCQFEDNWDNYEPIIISLYKDVIGQSVVKNTSGAISVVARSFSITKINGNDIRTDFDRSFCIVTIDTIGKKVRLFSYKCAL
ncbi:flagellar basal body protein [Histomonas meleagridis]|uniref:flagellar basal body protein n=1 Tax=Histomonas meleagridis TaxID=135588 RepID=UPI003559C67A|nr:flagellar basal body protein [Histomonas meleagridis]KAH0806172.1 flagellar basal body protein [Histomonas meleagridis]